MYPDENEAPLTLTKWPFYLGDALLVGLAITIAVLDNWKLNGIQVFACVLAVALGGGLLVLPFVTEYLMRVREEAEDHVSEDQLLKKQLENAEAALLKQQERLKQLESRSSLDDQRYELLTSAIDQKAQVELPDLTAMNERIAAIEAFGVKQTKMSDKVRKELAAFETIAKETANSLKVLQEQLNTIEKSNQEPPAEPAKAAPEEFNEPSVSGKRSKKVDSDFSLLQRAIQEEEDTAATAVSRIIDPASEITTSDSKAKEATVASSGHEDGADLPKVDTPKAKDIKAETAAPEIFSEIDILPEDFSVSLNADLMQDDDFFDAREIAEPVKSKPRKTKKSSATKKVKKNAASEQEEPSTNSEKATANSVTVSKLMGIGNKPFLRGSGGGLSWEKGVEMEFYEIGKWIWSVPADWSELVELQIYCNDEDADRKGKYTLQPGQKIEITPEF